MNFDTRARGVIVVVCSLLLSSALSGCGGHGPKRIQADGNDAVVSMGLDYADTVEVCSEMAQRLVSSEMWAYAPELEERPVRWVLGKINNNTPLRSLPTSEMLARIRSVCLKSGKVRFVSSYGDGATDSMPGDSQDLANDPRFDSSTAPKAGSLKAASMSLRTEINRHRASDGSSRQNTYVVHMFLSTMSGEIIWEEISSPISKKTTRGSVGW